VIEASKASSGLFSGGDGLMWDESEDSGEDARLPSRPSAATESTRETVGGQ
jgi:hypothetical protein